jgi:DNA polymerase I
LKVLFDELEFKALGTKILSELDRLLQNKDKPVQVISPPENSWEGTLFGEAIPASSEKLTFEKITHNYENLKTIDDIREVVIRMLVLKEVCFDIKTTSLNALESEILAIAFSWEKHGGCVIFFPASPAEAENVLETIRPVFENPEILKIGKNLKFEIQVLANYGIDVKGALFDTMIAHYLLEPDLRHNLQVLAETYLSYSPAQSGPMNGEKGYLQNNLNTEESEKVLEYAVEDADITFQLKNIFSPRIALEGLVELSTLIEMPLIRVLADMERNGVRLNLEDLKAITINLRDDIITLEKEIYYLAGTEFNISSPKQLGDILFIKLKLDDKARLTKTKQFITSEEILQRLSDKHPIINRVLEYRGLRKLLSTYVEALPLLVSGRSGRIHTSFNQAVAATGRLSSNNPNLQNIPMRDERGREIRKAFVPAEGYVFLSADYSQIELRLMAHLSKDPNMISDFLSGQDIHTATASKIFGVKIDDVTREMRNRAKTANFGIIYGISTFGLSERLNIGRKEAKELIDGYFNSYPGVKLYMEESIIKARELGYVTTMFGRKRYLRDINSRNQVVRGNAERNAINAPIQGSAADIIKIAMIRIHEKLKNENYRSKMILQVHDELIFEVLESELEKIREIVLYEMSHAVKLNVPIMVESGVGKNWHEAH